MRTIVFVFAVATALVAAPVTVKVRMKPNVTQSTVDMPLEKYVAAVLAGESSTFKSDEAMKAMAVAARSFAIHFRGRHAADGYDLCGTTHCQRVEPEHVTARLQSLADQTAGELLWYQGKPVFACYSRSCGGMTEDSAAVWSGLHVPFLSAHADPYCQRQPQGKWQWTIPVERIAAALHFSKLQAPAALAAVQIAQRTPSGRARVLLLEGMGETVRLAASSFRFAMGRALGWNTVRSDRWEVALAGDRLVFQGSGEGHGVGLCQRGADQMGLEGHSYREILAFYFPGAALGVTAKGFEWRRLTGERVALMTTSPERDGPVLATAERQVKEIAARFGWAPPKVEIRVYPDVETFRNATGEPGWVAARTSGSRIEMQPAAPRESTLRHELMHVFIEGQAKAGLPVWFREGLAAYLAGGVTRGAAEAGDDGVRQREDEGRARRANAGAVQRVAVLVQRYGAGTVIGWLRSGLPVGAA